MRLHNRQVKAAFWTDTDLLRNLKILGRHLYLGLIQLADDSGCLEDDPLAFKVHLFAADKGINGRVLSGLRDKLVEMKRLIPYEAGGKRCLFLRNFHKHQSLTNPGSPEVPLPPWVRFIPSESRYRGGRYEIDHAALDRAVAGLSQPCDGAVTACISGSLSNSNSGSEAGSRGEAGLPPVEKPAHTGHTARMSRMTHTGRLPSDSSGFDRFWAAYPRKVAKQTALRAYATRVKQGKKPDDMILAAENYRRHCEGCETEERFIMHPSTFLGPDCRFEDWIGEGSCVNAKAGRVGRNGRIPEAERRYREDFCCSAK